MKICIIISATTKELQVIVWNFAFKPGFAELRIPKCHLLALSLFPLGDIGLLLLDWPFISKGPFEGGDGEFKNDCEGEPTPKSGTSKV